jgi:uncharacterized membrane protein
MTNPKFSIAAAAAVIAMSTSACASTGGTETASSKMAAETVHCYGVNSCKGTADCATAENSCKGMNACKGHGFKAMTKDECLAKDGKVGA